MLDIARGSAILKSRLSRVHGVLIYIYIYINKQFKCQSANRVLIKFGNVTGGCELYENNKLHVQCRSNQ